MDEEGGEDMGFLTEATVQRSRVVRGISYDFLGF
jgi:hypothetical protein